ncbi:hypothetical protein R7Z10_18655 [Vibrio sp. Vb1018]|nr:hypothetical protein [Vibrio sp. Vb1018]
MNNKRLIELPSVRWVTATLLLLGIISAIVIALNSNLVWNLSYEGFNFFVRAFSVPITIITSILPIVGFIAVNHRSEQTKQQIELANAQILVAQNQNNFSNYYKHIEEFEKYVAHLYEPLNSINARRIHFYLFPNAKLGDFNPVTLEVMDFKDKMRAIAENALEFIKDGEKKSDLKFANSCSYLQQEIWHYGSDMGEKTENSVLVVTATDNAPQIKVLKGLKSLHTTVNGFRKLCAFENPQTRCDIEDVLLALHLRDKSHENQQLLIDDLNKIIRHCS